MANEDSQRILAEAASHMEKSVEALRRDLASLRTGRASPALVERIMVDYYGTPTPLHQLASISSPEPRLLLIQPWEKSLLPALERAILKSDLGLNPANDGRMLRLPIPPLTEERRHQLVKLMKRRLEEARVALRNIRREAMESLRGAEKEKVLSQDEARRAQEQLQKLTEAFITDAERLGQNKEAEILEE